MERNYFLFDIILTTSDACAQYLFNIKGPVTRKEAPRSQVQQIVYTDSKKHNAGLLV
jgi:hypothetical protein